MSEQQTERLDTEAIAEKWLQQCGPCDGGLPMGCTHPAEDYRPVMAALLEELERTRRGAKTLGHIVEQQGRMVLDVTGRHDLIAEDGDGDWGAVWDHLYELPSEGDPGTGERLDGPSFGDYWTPATPDADWDDLERWGQPPHNVHESAWAADRHTAEVEDG